MLIRAAAMSASKTTPVEAEKVIINLMNIFILSLDDHNMLVRSPTTCRRQISRTVALSALAALARGRALLWVRSGLVLGQMHHEHDQLQQQNIKSIIKLESSSPGVIISRQTRGN